MNNKIKHCLFKVEYHGNGNQILIAYRSREDFIRGAVTALLQADPEILLSGVYSEIQPVIAEASVENSTEKKEYLFKDLIIKLEPYEPVICKKAVITIVDGEKETTSDHLEINRCNWIVGGIGFIVQTVCKSGLQGSELKSILNRIEKGMGSIDQRAEHSCFNLTVNGRVIAVKIQRF